MMAATKRKRNVLSLQDKITIINRLEMGETGASLTKIFNIGKATISEIKANKYEILKFASKFDNIDGTKKRKSMKKANDEKLEDAIYLWFLQMRSQNEHITRHLLCEKALQLNQKLAGGSSQFKASTGWFKNFKSRHGIRNLEIQRDTSSGEVSETEAFKGYFRKMVDEEGFTKDDVYNADETGLNWKALPRNSLAWRREKATPDFIVNNQRVTVMVCANASGQHILPLLIVGKNKNPRCFKGVTCLPVQYRAQKNAWMDSNSFLDWFSHHFIPNVKKYRADEGKTGKVLLLIDNAPCHSAIEQLNAVDENFIVKLLPSNITDFLQPMGQGIVEKLKRMYKKQFLRRLQLPDEGEESIVEFLKNLNLKDCCYMLVDVWIMLPSDYLKKAWYNLWSSIEDPIIHEYELNEKHEDIRDILSLFQEIPGFAECRQDDVVEWLNNDVADLGYKILNEDEIITLIQNEEHDDDSNDEEQEEVGNEPTHVEAFNTFETAMAWCERQPECNPMEILLLKRMRDLAAIKMVHGNKCLHFKP